MATLKYAIPGIGGSLGMCVVCGDTFTAELILGTPVGGLKIEGIDRELPAHKECAEKVIAMQGKWKDIRENFPDGPLKRCFDEQLAEGEAHGGTDTE